MLDRQKWQAYLDYIGRFSPVIYLPRVTAENTEPTAIKTNKITASAEKPTVEQSYAIATPAVAEVDFNDQVAAQTSLDNLRLTIADCQNCGLAQARNKLVFGEGDQQAKLVIVGEGPGRDEDASGRPFVGLAGRLLDILILAMGIKRQSVYITNVVKCRPPGNRNPSDQEVTACSAILEKQLQLIQPKLVLILGAVALKALLPDCPRISEARGKFYQRAELDYLVSFHPAYILRNGKELGKSWHDFKLARDFISAA